MKTFPTEVGLPRSIWNGVQGFNNSNNNSNNNVLRSQIVPVAKGGLDGWGRTTPGSGWGRCWRGGCCCTWRRRSPWRGTAGCGSAWRALDEKICQFNGKNVLLSLYLRWQEHPPLSLGTFHWPRRSDKGWEWRVKISFCPLFSECVEINDELSPLLYSSQGMN